MATAIKYFDTAKVAHCRITTGVTATDGSGTETQLTWYNSAPSGDWFPTKIIVTATSATGVGDIADSLLHIFVDDASTPRLIRTVDLGNPAAGTTALSAYQLEINMGPEFVMPSTVLLSFQISVTPTAGNLDIVVFAQAA